MKSWRAALGLYADRRVLALFVLGFASGLPLLLVYSTLSFWLRQEGASLTEIGWFSLAGTAYGFKLLWAPLVDHARLPGLGRLLGQRRSWLLVAQIATAAGIVVLGASDPGEALTLTAFWAVGLAFCSATQDIVVDALRIEMLDDEEQGGGAANFVNGYRVGTLAAGAGALIVADLAGWFWAYAAMAALMVPGMAVTLWLPEPRHPVARSEGAGVGARFRAAVVEPFREFAGREHWLAILVFVAVYKYGDALLGAMANSFYADMGFSGTEIAVVTKGWGLAMSLVGAVCGGVLVARCGLLTALFVTGVGQLTGNLAFAALASTGKSLTMLTLAIAVENLTGAMATAAFVAYLSALCDARFTATQYALLTSLTAQARTVFAAGGGWLADQLGWTLFFIATVAAAAPGLILLVWLMRRVGHESLETGDAAGDTAGPGETDKA
ncbi:MAG: AmpG family muropeptide MFS transporter [Rhodospirillaceae bacterium]